MYVCVTFAIENLHLFFHFSHKIGKVSLFILLHDLSPHSSFPHGPQKDSGCFCACLPTLPPLLKARLLSCAEPDLSSASEHTETPASTMGNLVLGAFHAFCDVLAVKVALLRESGGGKPHGAAGRAPSKAASCRHRGSGKVGRGAPQQGQV